MKKFIRSLCATLLTFGLFGPATQAFAATPQFNNMANDREFLVGRNLTKNGPWVDPVQNVDKDDIVEVAVYYHNTVPGATANNTKIKITLPTAESMTHVIKGQLSADNAAAVTGTVVNGVETGRPDLTVETTSKTNIHFVPGSVRWYPNRMDTNGAGASLPFGQNGDSLVTSGINIGDIDGCWQFSGFVIFKVKFTSKEEPPAKAILQLKKEVRKAGTDDVFVTKNTVTPGDKVEYRLTVRNIDGKGVATAVRLKDTLPNGVTYVGPTYLTRNGQTTQLPDGITSGNGIIVVPDLQPLEQITVTFVAQTANSFANEECVVNKVGVTANNADLPADATAETCFSVPPTPTPTPTPPPTPNPTATPKPELPKTGPAGTLAALLGLSGIAGTAGRFYHLKRQLKKSARGISVI